MWRFDSLVLRFASMLHSNHALFFYALALDFIQAVPMNAVLRIGNKTLCESVALIFAEVHLSM